MTKRNIVVAIIIIILFIFLALVAYFITWFTSKIQGGGNGDEV